MSEASSGGRERPQALEMAPANALLARVPSRRLDFLRGAAALYVLIGHARGHLFAGGAQLAAQRDLAWPDYVMLALLQSTSMGTEAVIIFFVLSGYAMAHSFTHSQSPAIFYKKRAIRIWPPYLVAVVFAFLLAAIILRSPEANAITESVSATKWGIGEFLRMIFYSKVDTVLTAQFWSLPQEVLFYFLCPLLLVSKKHVNVFYGIALVLTISGAMFFGVYDDPTIGGGIVYRHFFTLLIFFMTGAVAYHYQHRIPHMSGGMLMVLFVLVFAGIWFVKYQIFNGWNLISSLLTAPLALLLIGNVPASLYDRKWLNWGHFSYSLYIVHMQLIIMVGYVLARVWGIEQPQMTSYWMWLLVVPPIVLLGRLFYLVTEKRCNSVLLRIRAREKEATGLAPIARQAGR